MEPFRWRRALFLGLVSYAASLAAPVFDTFVPVLLQAGHPLWHNTTGLHAPLVGFALAPSLAFFIMTWDKPTNWLQVLDTAERTQIYQRVRHQFHAVVSLLDAFKAEQQPLELVLPGKGSLNPQA
jgi:hypothetical protein